MSKLTRHDERRGSFWWDTSGEEPIMVASVMYRQRLGVWQWRYGRPSGLLLSGSEDSREVAENIVSDFLRSDGREVTLAPA